MKLSSPSQLRDLKIKAACRGVVEPLEQRVLLSAVVQNGILCVLGTDSPDQIRVSLNRADSSKINVDINGSVQQFAKSQLRGVSIMALNGNDRLTIDDSKGAVALPVEAFGNDGDDSLIGGGESDTLWGGRGRDLLMGGAGNDDLHGGRGEDRIFGGVGDDTLKGGLANDIIDDSEGNNLSDGGTGTNNVGSNIGFQPLTASGLRDGVNPSVFNGTIDGYTPTQMRRAYNFSDLNDYTDPGYANRGSGQTIAIVDAFHSPTAANDLYMFSQTFNLPLPDPTGTLVNPYSNYFTFKQVSANSTWTPAVDSGWAMETALDVQWAHAIAPKAKIILVEADSNLAEDIYHAVEIATSLVNADGGGVVSMSFGANDGVISPFRTEQAWLERLRTLFGTNRNVSYIASSGDDGSISFPASSAYVTAVGGTFVALDEQGYRLSDEVAWVLGGSGVAPYGEVPGYQKNTKIGGVTIGSANGEQHRVVPDIAYNADPVSGVTVFNTTPDDGFIGWQPVGGTSAGAPQIAGLVALANERRVAMGSGHLGNNLNATLYKLGNTQRDLVYRDIVSGSAGGNLALPGFDSATGWGSPIANYLIDALSVSQVSYISTPITWSATLTQPFNVGAIGQSRTAHYGGGTGFADGSDRIQLTFDAPAALPTNGTGNTGLITNFNNLYPTITVDNIYRTGNSIYGYGTATYTYVMGTLTGSNTVLLKFTGNVSTNLQGGQHISGEFFTVDWSGNRLYASQINGETLQGNFEG